MATFSLTVRAPHKDSVPGLKYRVIKVVGDTDIPASPGYQVTYDQLGGFDVIHAIVGAATTNGVYVCVPKILSSTNKTVNLQYFNLDDGVVAAAGENGVDGTVCYIQVFGN